MGTHYCEAERFDPQIRIFKHVRKTKTCWLWTSGIDRDGYPRIRWGYPRVKVSRLLYELTYGKKIPNDLLACHKCDVKRCVRPSHIFIGTHKDNAMDAIKKNRWPVGEMNPRSTLTNFQAVAIKRLSKWYSAKSISKLLHVSLRPVDHIVAGSSWKHVDSRHI